MGERRGGQPEMKRSLTLLLMIYTGICFVVSLAVHASLYFGFNMREALPYAWLLLQLSVLGSLAAIAVAYRSTVNLKPEHYTEHSRVLLIWTVLFVFFLPYALFNFFYTSSLLQEGYLDVVGGEHVIVTRGRRLITLSAAQLPAYQLYEARKYSGHWMICHLFAFMLLFVDFKWSDKE